MEIKEQQPPPRSEKKKNLSETVGNLENVCLYECDFSRVTRASRSAFAIAFNFTSLPNLLFVCSELFINLVRMNRSFLAFQSDRIDD